MPVWCGHVRALTKCSGVGMGHCAFAQARGLSKVVASGWGLEMSDSPVPVVTRPAGLTEVCPVHREVIGVFRWQSPVLPLKAFCPCCGVYLRDVPQTHERLAMATGVPR